MNRIRVAIALFLCVVLCTGCWDRVEINDVAFVLGTAIDREGEGYRVSVLIPLPGNMGGPSGGGGAGGKKPYTIKSEVGATPREAIDKLQFQLSRRLFFAHRRVFLVGEDVFKQETGVLPVLDTILRVAESRLTTFIAATKGKAEDMLGANVKLERFTAEAIREILQSDASIRLSIKDVVLSMSQTGQEALIPYLEVVKSKAGNEESEEVRAAGYVMTKDGKQVGLLQGNEARAMRFLLGKFRPASLSVQTEAGATQVKISRVTKKIKPYLSGDKIHFDIKVYIEGDVDEDLSTTTDTFSDIPEIEKVMNEELTAHLKTVIERLKSKKSDIGFGEILSRYYPSRWENDWKPHWEDEFPECEMHITVSTKIYRIGMIRENLAVKDE